jgi:hypothetical protein
VHTSKEVQNQTDSLLPSDYVDMSKDWQFSYFVLKSTTNGAIMVMALASFLSITLVGAYLALTIMTADFCADPMNNTIGLVGSTGVATTPSAQRIHRCLLPKRWTAFG